MVTVAVAGALQTGLSVIPDLDLVVATFGGSGSSLKGMSGESDSRSYAEWLSTVPRSRLIVTRRSGHNVPVEQPELVVEAIRQVVRNAR